MDVLRNYSVTVFPLCAGVIGELGGAIVDDLSVSPAWGYRETQTRHYSNERYFPCVRGYLGYIERVTGK